MIDQNKPTRRARVWGIAVASALAVAGGIGIASAASAAPSTASCLTGTLDSQGRITLAASCSYPTAGNYNVDVTFATLLRTTGLPEVDVTYRCEYFRAPLRTTDRPSPPLPELVWTGTGCVRVELRPTTEPLNA